MVELDDAQAPVVVRGRTSRPGAHWSSQYRCAAMKWCGRRNIPSCQWTAGSAHPQDLLVASIAGRISDARTPPAVVSTIDSRRQTGSPAAVAAARGHVIAYWNAPASSTDDVDLGDRLAGRPSG